MRQVCRKCIRNVHRLLDSAKILLANRTTEQYSLGLYMYAIEEYGKAQLVKASFLSNKSIYLLPDWIFGMRRPPSGKTSHEEKLIEGLKNLPKECSKLTPSIQISVEDLFSNQKLQKAKQLGISFSRFQTGILEDVTNGPSRDIDFDYKNACFYVDWDKTKGRPNYILPASKKQLKYNIELFKDILRKENFI